MTMEVTRKQAILLAVLGVVLVLIIYVQLLIRPTWNKISEAKEQADTLNQQYETLLQQAESYDMNLQALEDWRVKNSEETSKLYPLSKPERIDNFLNSVIHQCGATITGLDVAKTQQYYIDAENNLILADPDVVEEEAGDGSMNGEEAATYTATGEYRMDLTYSMSGNYEDMCQLMDFLNKVSFLGLTSYSFDSVEDEETHEFVDDYTFTMTISAYMYKDPLKTLEIEETSDQSLEESTDEVLANTNTNT